MFFGRNDLLVDLERTLHNNCFLIYREQRIGKTSLQHQLRERLQQAEDPTYRFIPAYIDLQRVAEADFFRTIAAGVVEQTEILSKQGDLIMQNLTEQVKNLALEKGAHLVGIASVDRFEGAPRGHHPEDLLPGAKSVIVIAKRFFQTILDSDKFCTDSEVIPPDEVWDVQQTMFMFMYNTLNMHMQMIGVEMSHFLSEQGYPSLPFPSGGYGVGGKSPNFPGGRYAFFSHRHAAVAAGLGEMGLNNLLLTPKYGPRIRLHSTITTAELTPDPIIKEQICLGEEECGLCLKAETCYGKIYDFEMCGKKMRLAEFQGCQKDLCKRENPKGVLPYIRYCIGVCPVGKDNG